MKIFEYFYDFFLLIQKLTFYLFKVLELVYFEWFLPLLQNGKNVYFNIKVLIEEVEKEKEKQNEIKYLTSNIGIYANIYFQIIFDNFI
jgi:hypothetical protein